MKLSFNPLLLSYPPTCARTSNNPKRKRERERRDHITPQPEHKLRPPGTPDEAQFQSRRSNSVPDRPAPHFSSLSFFTISDPWIFFPSAVLLFDALHNQENVGWGCGGVHASRELQSRYMDTPHLTSQATNLLARNSLNRLYHIHDNYVLGYKDTKIQKYIQPNPKNQNRTPTPPIISSSES